MKVKLLNDGIYAGLDSVKFPLIVPASEYYSEREMVVVEVKDLVIHGADARWFDGVNAIIFTVPTEAEIIDE